MKTFAWRDGQGAFFNNHSLHYDGAVFLESVSKLHREESAFGSQEIGESVTIDEVMTMEGHFVTLRPESSSKLR